MSPFGPTLAELGEGAFDCRIRRSVANLTIEGLKLETYPVDDVLYLKLPFQFLIPPWGGER